MSANEPAPNWDALAVIAQLKTLGSEDSRAGMARYGIATGTALGIPNAILRPMAKQLKRDHERACALWDSDIREARLLACFTDEPKKVTPEQARDWAQSFDSWEIVDHSAALFVEAGLADQLISDFASDDREFVRRCAFAMMAWGAVHLKKRPDEQFLDWLTLIGRHAGDNRNFVRKAVSWSLRQIGKRSAFLHAPALLLAQELAACNDRAARWIGADAQRELTSDKTLQKLQLAETRN